MFFLTACDFWKLKHYLKVEDAHNRMVYDTPALDTSQPHHPQSVQKGRVQFPQVLQISAPLLNLSPKQ